MKSWFPARLSTDGATARGSQASPVRWPSINIVRMKGFTQLLIALVVLTLLEPIVRKFRILSLAALLVLLDGLYVTLPQEIRVGFRKGLFIVWAAAGVAIVATWFGVHSWFYTSSEGVSVVLQTTLIAICLATTLRHILKERTVTIDLLAAAMVGYFFIVFLFNGFFRIMVLFDPQAFSLQPWNVGKSALEPRTELLYFSFVTAATLGYGDIIPRNGFAQMLSVMEAVIGQFYLATVIARLVSLYREEPQENEAK